MNTGTTTERGRTSGGIGELLVRPATLRDIGPIQRLVNAYAAQGIMLPRTEFEMAETIRDFSVAVAGDELVGCGALHFYTPWAGEIRSLAVNPASKGMGVGRSLMEALEAEAREHQLGALFAFTYVAEFFKRHGFHVTERGELPLKAWKDCLRCPKFQNCDEIAVLKRLGSGNSYMGGSFPVLPTESVLLPQVP